MQEDDIIAAQVRAASRVSFGVCNAFAAFERELAAATSPTTQAQSIARKTTTFRSPRDGVRHPNFRTLARSEDSATLRAEAARRNDAARSPYRAPSDHRFRLESPPSSWLVESTDFRADFAVPSNQDVRRRTALDQVGGVHVGVS